jgi:hypothetical protein
MTATEGGIVVGPGEGKLLLPDRWWLPLGAADTSGGMAIMEALPPPAARPTRTATPTRSGTSSTGVSRSASDRNNVRRALARASWFRGASCRSVERHN